MDFEEMNTELQTVLESQFQELKTLIQNLQLSNDKSENESELKNFLFKKLDDWKKNADELNERTARNNRLETENLKIEMRGLVGDFQKEISSDIKNFYGDAEKKVSKTFDAKFRELTKINKKNFVKNAVAVACLAILLFLGGGFSLWYVQTYKDGRILAEKALSAEKAKIEKDAIENYKASKDFKNDSALYVAKHFRNLDVLEVLYQEIPAKDKKDLGISELLKSAHEQYKNKN